MDIHTFPAITIDRLLEPTADPAGSATGASAAALDSCSRPFLRSNTVKPVRRRDVENGNRVSPPPPKRYHSVPPSSPSHGSTTHLAHAPFSFPSSTSTAGINPRPSLPLLKVSASHPSFKADDCLPRKENGKSEVLPLVGGSSSGSATKNCSNEGGGDTIYRDPREASSFSSNTDGEDSCSVDGTLLSSQNTTVGEFYDAFDEISAASGSATCKGLDVKKELSEIRFSLLAEIDKRRETEEILKNMQNQWKEMKNCLFADLVLSEFDGEDERFPEEARQQFLFLQTVSESIAKEVGRSEMEDQMESKDLEIARLRDQLRNYQVMNREMSQWNQENTEMERRSRKRVLVRRKRMIWGLVGAAVTVGCGVLAWSYLLPPSSSSSSSSLMNQDKLIQK